MSFIVKVEDAGSIFALAMKMIKLRGFDSDKKLRAIIRRSRLDPNTPISFGTCNYRTYLLKVGDYIVAQTCNNHATWWSEMGLNTCELDKELAETLIEMGLPDRRANPDDLIEVHEVIQSHLAELSDFWFPERGFTAREVVDNRIYCDKCYEDFVKTTNGKLVCPSCGKERKPKK
jgi:hypothetical protein